jgi:hypothetical protein
MMLEEKYAINISRRSVKLFAIIFFLRFIENRHSSPSIIRMIKLRRMRWAWHLVRTGEKRNAYRILVGMPEGKGPLERPRRRWVDNIKMDLTEIVGDGINWIDLAQTMHQRRTLVNTVMNLRVP